jgi:hypothetical protein
VRRLLVLLLAACHAPAIAHIAQAETAGPVTVLYTLTDATGLAVRGALTELDGRLYGLAGERGPNGTTSCSSTALWRTPEHTLRCPGSLFSLNRDGSGFRVDHAFTQLDSAARNADGYHAYGTLAVGRDGRLYGVTQMGGNPTMEPGEVGYGVLFAYGPPRGDDPGSYEILHTFGSEMRAADGEYPMGALAVDPAGNVFGTTKGGGVTSTGTVWEWSPGGAFRFAPLPGETYGGVALAGGLLHGTTWAPGAGVYFAVSPETLQVRVVDSFPAFTANEHGTDNTPIQAPLALSDGSVVAAREFGGAAGAGLVVRLDPKTGITVLHDSADIPLAAAPRFSNITGGMLNGQIAEGRDGMVYGTAQYGGAAGTGGIWRMARDGSLFSLVYSWPDGAYPYGGLTATSDGALWGVTFNTNEVFRFDPRAVGGCRP